VSGLQSKRISEKSPRTTSAESNREAEDVVRDLREALRNVGIVLPSLRVDLVGYCNETPRHLIELGRCNVATARTIVKVLKGKAD
jgi:hypothetical protein